MANIIPDEIRNIDEVGLNEQVQTIYEYIKYMREMLEFWSSNVNRGTGLAAEGISDRITKTVKKDVDGQIKILASDFRVTEEEVSSIMSEIWPGGDTHYDSRITQNASQIATAINAIWPNGTESSSQFTQLSNQIATKVSQTTYDSLAGRVTTAESNITQNANNISSKVSTTDYTGARIASLINQSASSVTIAAAHINLNGVVTANNYFKINTDGSMECKKATITGGSVDLPSTDESSSLLRVIYEDSGGTSGVNRRVSAVRPYMFQQLSYGNRIRCQMGSGRVDFIDTEYSSSIAKAQFGLGNVDTSGNSYGTFRLSNASGTSRISGLGSTGALTCVSLTQTSDRNQKRDIEKIDTAKAADLIYNLNPVSFKFIDTDSAVHHGLIAQEVEEFADWDVVSENEGMKTLNYIELIPDMIATIQSLNERIKSLESIIRGRE